MAYVYCRNCDAGSDDPSFEECVRMRIICHSCGYEIELGHAESTDALIALEQRISNIEQQLEELNQ